MTPAEADCRAAWAAAPNAKWAWCCHHAVRLEPLTESDTARIDYIRVYKPEHEQEWRFNNFRPVLSPLPAALVEARAGYDEVRAARNIAWATFAEARAAYNIARAAYVVTPECAEAHRRDVPDHTWNGVDIF